VKRLSIPSLKKQKERIMIEIRETTDQDPRDGTSKPASLLLRKLVGLQMKINSIWTTLLTKKIFERINLQWRKAVASESRGDVPGWVLVVLMTTALVTGIWSIAAPKLTMILRNSLDAMAGIK
jgi:hypothetical protein